MLEMFTELLDVDIDFKTVFIIIGVYLVFLWTIFSFWVLVDAQKRYQRVYISVPMFLFVLLFNFPALIFYLVTRPDLEEAGFLGLYPDDSHTSSGGVHVPLVNFKGDEGVELTLQLKVAKHPSLIEKPADMHINVDWISENQNLEVVQKPLVVDVATEEVPDHAQRGFFKRVSFRPVARKVNFFPKVRSGAVNLKGKLQKKPEDSSVTGGESQGQQKAVPAGQTTTEGGVKPQSFQKKQSHKKRNQKKKEVDYGSVKERGFEYEQ